MRKAVLWVVGSLIAVTAAAFTVTATEVLDLTPIKFTKALILNRWHKVCLDGDTCSQYVSGNGSVLSGSFSSSGEQSFTAGLTVSGGKVDALAGGYVDGGLLVKGGLTADSLVGLQVASGVGYVAGPFAVDGGVVFNNGVKVGGAGSTISQIYLGSGTIDFAEIAQDACEDAAATVTVTGATAGKPCFVGVPAAFAAGMLAQCIVTATSTVTVRACNQTASAVNLASGTYAAAVIQ